MKTRILLLLTVLIQGFYLQSFAQNDSVKTEYTQEKLTESAKFESTLCELITKREKKEKDLWKYDLLGTLFSGFNISYEHKLAQKWSVNIHSVTNAPLLRGISVLGNQGLSRGYSEQLSVDLRFWYDQNRRLRKGKKAGFTGGYFGLSLIGFGHVTYVSPYDASPAYRTSGFNPYLTLQCGYQWRIGRLGFIDAHAGYGLGYNFFYKDGTPDPGNKSYKLYQTIDLHLGVGIAF
jgi:hypothetical protein